MLAVFLETPRRQLVGYPTGRFRNLEFTNNRKKLLEKFHCKQRKCARGLSLSYYTLRSSKLIYKQLEEARLIQLMQKSSPA